MNSPPLAEFLDKIKEMYEGSTNIPAVYKIVKILARYDGSMSVVCGKEIAHDFDDLCVKMFDLDVSGWEILGEIVGESMQSHIGSLYNVVIIRMTRMI